MALSREERLKRKIEYQKKYRAANREKTRASQKRYRTKHPEVWRSIMLKTLYGITLEQYTELYTKQGGCCSICNKHQEELNRRLAVDHCHKTGRIRGLLCLNCNRGMGYLQDSANVLRSAIRYLEGTPQWIKTK